MVPAFYLLPTAAAQTPTALADKLAAADSTIKTWEKRALGVEKELKLFGITLPQKEQTPQAPEAPANGDTAVSCESALLFDAENSSLVYVGNVFLQDARLNLFARNRLFIRMETGVKSQEKAKEAVKTPAAKSTTSTPAAPAREPKAETPAAKSLDFKGGRITTHDAVVNALDNCIILASPAGAEPIHLEAAENEVWIRPDATTPARLLADAEGNIMLSGAGISIKWVDENGQVSTLETNSGIIYYHAADATITMPNGGTLTHPDGQISCSQELCAQLRKSTAEKPKKDGFMQQFSSMQFDGLRSATARGNVRAVTTGTQGSQPGKLVGDELVYDGDTGACSLTGSKCAAEYGKHAIFSNEAIVLHPNGNLELKGTDIHGRYERPASDKAAKPLAGSFKAHGNIIFHADTGVVTADKGIQATDAEISFSCTGPVHVQLAKAANAAPAKAPAPGMPNLAIADYREVISLTAQGNITAHQLDPKTAQRIGMLSAETLNTNLTTGETTLEGTSSTPAIAEHNGNTLKAMPGKTIPKLHLAANGDINLSGDTIHAEIQSDGGKTTAKCKDYIRLNRASNQLETGSNAVMQSPEGIFTTNKSLYADLIPEKDAKPATGKLAHLRFNYAGINQAYTQGGGTMRTVQGSMQCTGPIRIILTQAKQGKEHELGGISKATASGNVGIAGKDNKGRIVTAHGDHLSVDAASGIKRLTGSRVILADQYNTHIVSGKNAAITIDSKNNARISGEKHSTIATKLHEQMNKEKSNKK